MFKNIKKILNVLGGLGLLTGAASLLASCNEPSPSLYGPPPVNEAKECCENSSLPDYRWAECEELFENTEEVEQSQVSKCEEVLMSFEELGPALYGPAPSNEALECCEAAAEADYSRCIDKFDAGEEGIKGNCEAVLNSFKDPSHEEPGPALYGPPPSEDAMKCCTSVSDEKQSECWDKYDNGEEGIKGNCTAVIDAVEPGGTLYGPPPSEDATKCCADVSGDKQSECWDKYDNGEEGIKGNCEAVLASFSSEEPGPSLYGPPPSEDAMKCCTAVSEEKQSECWDKYDNGEEGIKGNCTAVIDAVEPGGTLYGPPPSEEQQ